MHRAGGPGARLKFKATRGAGAIKGAREAPGAPTGRRPAGAGQPGPASQGRARCKSKTHLAPIKNNSIIFARPSAGPIFCFIATRPLAAGGDLHLAAARLRHGCAISTRPGSSQRRLAGRARARRPECSRPSGRRRQQVAAPTGLGSPATFAADPAPLAST